MRSLARAFADRRYVVEALRKRHKPENHKVLFYVCRHKCGRGSGKENLCQVKLKTLRPIARIPYLLVRDTHVRFSAIFKGRQL